MHGNCPAREKRIGSHQPRKMSGRRSKCPAEQWRLAGHFVRQTWNSFHKDCAGTRIPIKTLLPKPLSTKINSDTSIKYHVFWVLSRTCRSRYEILLSLPCMHIIHFACPSSNIFCWIPCIDSIQTTGRWLHMYLDSFGSFEEKTPEMGIFGPAVQTSDLWISTGHWHIGDIHKFSIDISCTIGFICQSLTHSMSSVPIWWKSVCGSTPICPVW